MKLHDLNIDDRRLGEFCRRRSIRELSLFGAIVRDDFHAQSDVDVIIDPFPPDRLSLMDLAEMQLELSEMLGRQVHLHTPDMLHPYLRDRIRSSAHVAYAA